MRDYEKMRIRETIATVKFMQKMKFDKYVILNNLDSIIEKLRINASNDFINCLFDIRQKVVLDKDIKQEVSNYVYTFRNFMFLYFFNINIITNL